MAKHPEIVGFGHILYDLRCYVESFPKPDKTSFVKGNFKGSVGGSATNVCCNAAKLGKTSAIIGKIGFDDRGQIVLNSLRKIGVNTSGVRIDSKARTGTSIVVIDSNGTPAVIEMLGANEKITLPEIDLSLIRNAKIIHLTGAPIQLLEAVSSAAKSAGKTVTFDPGRSISRLGSSKLSKILRNSDILIINSKEARELGGGKALKNIFPGKPFVIKGGKLPTIVYEAETDAFFTIGTIPIKVKDTIGAGDAFSGGLLVKLLSRAGLKEAVQYGNACGALKATREGADGLPRKKEADSFFRKNKEHLAIRKAGKARPKI